MNISIENLPKSQAEIKIEVGVDKFQTYLAKAAAKISLEKKISGFRPGKATIEAVRNQIGEQALLNEAAQAAASELLIEAAKQEAWLIVGQPAYAIDNLKFNEPFKFTATVSLVPEITLGDIKQIKIKSFKDLKTEVIKDLDKDIEQRVQQKQEDELFMALATQTKFGEIPEVLINTEVGKLIHELNHTLSAQGIKLEDHLKRLGKKESDLALDYAPRAMERVKTSLVLRQIVKDQNINVSDEEYSRELAKLKDLYKDNQAMLKQIDTPQHKEYLGSTLLYRKVVEYLKSVVVED